MGNLNDDIERYRKGEMSPREMHALEKKALSDSFLADALEGAGQLTAKEFSDDVAQLRKSLRASGGGSIFTPLRIAAGVVVLIGAGLFLAWPSNEPAMVASNETKVEEPPRTDSIRQDVTSAAGFTPAEEQLARAEQRSEVADSPEKAETQPLETKAKEEDSSVADHELVAGLDATTAAAQETPVVAADSTVRPTIAELRPAPAVRSNTTKVSGNVTVAEDGLPLPGVNVTVKGTSVGTTTDSYGNYSIEAPEGSELVFSFVGMQNSEHKVAPDGKLDVKLLWDATQLSEIVITRSALPRPETDGPVVRMAEPVGGIKAYDKYMEDNLRYPQLALDNNVKGRVVVEFSVGTDGSLGDFVVMRSLGYGCDEEVIRLVKEGPRWMPTIEDDTPVISNVRVRMKFDAAKVKNRKK